MADAYVYVDWNADGQFDYSLYDNGTPADGSEIVAYSYAENRDSRGNFLTSRPAAPSLPIISHSCRHTSWCLSHAYQDRQQ